MTTSTLLPVCSHCRRLAPDAKYMGQECPRCHDGVFVSRQGDVCSLCRGAGTYETAAREHDCEECGGKGWKEA